MSERDLRTIVAVFFDPRAAYDYEQNLIAEMWGDPLLLNGSVHTNDSRFMNGLEGKKLTEAHKRAISASHCGKKDEHTLKKPNTCCQPNEKAERLHEWGLRIPLKLNSD